MDQETMEELIRMSGESMELDIDRADIRVTPELKRTYRAYEEALERSLSNYVKDDDLVDELMADGDAGYNVLMTLRGEGVGIWDGRWDGWFSADEIEALTAHLKRDLSRYSEETGTGSVEEALNNAALLAAGEIEPSNGLSRNAAPGVYAELGLGEGDYVLWKHSLSGRVFIDRVGDRGRKTLIGQARGYPSASDAVRALMADAHQRGEQDGLIFDDAGAQIGEFHGRDFWPMEDGVGEYVENPPGWVRDEDIWADAKAAVEDDWERYDDPWAVVAHVYKQMGGRIGSKANPRRPPPAPPRPGRPDYSRRIRRMAEEGRRERFDPEAPREHYAKPHHFAINRR